MSIKKHYSNIVNAANVTVAVGIAGSYVIGSVSSLMALKTIVVSTVVCGILTFAGTFMKKDMEDGTPFWDEDK
jgi:hypothetical protein